MLSCIVRRNITGLESRQALELATSILDTANAAAAGRNTRVVRRPTNTRLSSWTFHVYLSSRLPSPRAA